jgi:hypothetical protein
MSEPAPHPQPANASGERIEPTLPMPAGPAHVAPGSTSTWEPVTPVPYSPPLPPAQPPSRGVPLFLDVDEAAARPRSIPILGGLSAIFGICSLFKAPLVLGPLAMIFGIAALYRRQVSLGAIGGIAGLVGLLISPLFWAIVGLGWLGTWLWAWLLG